MKGIFKILRYIKKYKRFAILNISFNILQLIFSLFSLTMVIPLADILFNTDHVAYMETLKNPPPALALHHSSKDLTQYLKYYITQSVVNNGAEHILILICVVFVIVVLLKNLFRYLAVFYMAPIRNGVVKDIRNELFSKALILPLSYYSDERKGDIMSRMTSDVQEVEWSIMQSIEMLTVNPLQMLIFLGALIFISPQLTIFVFVLLPVTGLLIARIAKSLKRSSAKSKEQMGLLFSMIEETLGGLRIIKAFNAENKTRSRFLDENNRYTRIMNRVYRKTDLASPLSEFLASIIIAIIMYFGGKLVWSEAHSLSGELFVGYLVVFSQLIPPAKAFTQAYYTVQKGMASVDRINKILKSEVTIREKAQPVEINSFEKEIDYKNVSFAYQRGDIGWALKNINLTIPKGKTIAIVGQSGSGKSTLVDMLPRFYDPTEGEITIDGKPLTELSLKSIRNLMGIVTQESILFNDTVKNNITFGMSGITDEQVMAAAKVANAHTFIMNMENGYETNIGDRGSKLSGGERQRMSIARAILKNPPLLILDEATSALDTESEKLVQDALSNLMANRTSIVIAHRLSTIKNADEIVVMQKGIIVERGTHTGLIATNGVYKKLYDLQSFV